MTTEQRRSESGDVLTGEWVRDPHLAEDSLRAGVSELGAAVAELKQLL